MRISILLLFFTTLFGARATYAQPKDSGGSSVEVVLQVKPPDPANPKERNKAPEIEATIIGGQKTTMDKLTLSTTNAGQKVTMRASKVREYTEGKETIAIALVINGQEIWIGNEDYEQDENAKYNGVLKNLSQAIDKLQLGNAGPQGSKGIVISYSTGAEIKLAMGDLKLITGAALGNQQDYRGKIGTDMVQGITMAYAELTKVATARKALIVVGDGNDTNNEAAKTALAQLKKDASKANIQTFAIIYKSAVSSEGNVITTMVPTAKTVNSIDGIASELNAIIARMADRFYVTFPGYDDKTKTGLPWDGKDHDLVLKNDQIEYEPVTMQLAPPWKPPVTSSFPWLGVILGLLGLILLIVIVKVATRKKPEPMPMPMPMQMAPAPEAPKPAGPMKTVMIGAGGDQDGFPIVGWIVALNGVDAYKTQRLKAGLTKIGTAPPSDIVVNDGFMSTEHCQITCSPAGFTLIDNGATNGCYVNDRKVQKHDLVDHDLITPGQTNLQFQSTNPPPGFFPPRPPPPFSPPSHPRARRDHLGCKEVIGRAEGAEGLRRLPSRDVACLDEVSVLRLGARRAARVHPRSDGEPDAAAHRRGDDDRVGRREHGRPRRPGGVPQARRYPQDRVELRARRPRLDERGLRQRAQGSEEDARARRHHPRR